MYVRGCISVREREVEECAEGCVRFMMVNCEEVELRRVLKTLRLGLKGLGNACPVLYISSSMVT